VSTFSSLNAAYSGLAAAKAGIDVVGQNISNVGTDGYTRQRLNTSSVPGATRAGMFSVGVAPGQGVAITGVARLGDASLDAALRAASASSGYASVRADTLSSFEQSLNEPGSNGLSAGLHDFWAAWQAVSNQAGDPAPAGALLGSAATLTARLSTIYRGVQSQWGTTRASVDSMVSDVNAAAKQVAELNVRIRQSQLAGDPANELLDQRAQLTTSLAAAVGGTVRDAGDGTVDVLVGGNPLVTGGTARAIAASGSAVLEGASADPVTLTWVDHPGVPLTLQGGRLAGALSVLAPADGQGRGGMLAEAAASLDSFAVTLAGQVNAVHRTGVTASGATDASFFGFDPGQPAALGLHVIPTGVDGIAAAAPGAGGKNGTVADQISGLGAGAGSPDSVWASFVVGIGTASKSEQQQADLAELGRTSAENAQLSQSSVDLDEENTSLIALQHAYQAAARVMTTIDQTLDTLINHTGTVGL
jgi:flagellar hook-associated protein 1 FlgK